MPHVQLANRRPLEPSVRLSIDHEAAHPANPFAAIVVERNRILALLDQALVQHIQHLQKRHVLVGVRHLVPHQPAAIARHSSAAKHASVSFTCNSVATDAHTRTSTVPYSTPASAPSPLILPRRHIRIISVVPQRLALRRLKFLAEMSRRRIRCAPAHPGTSIPPARKSPPRAPPFPKTG